MKHTTFFFLFSILLFACENKKQQTQIKKEDSYKKRIVANRIRFEKVYEYEYRFGKPDTTKSFLTKIIEYDTAGNVIKSETFNKEDFMKQFDEIEEYKYDNKGNNIETTSKTAEGLFPPKKYLNHLLAGQDILSEEYFNQLSKTKTCDD